MEKLTYRKMTFEELDTLDAFTFTPDDDADWYVKVDTLRCIRGNGKYSYLRTISIVYQIVTVNITGDEWQKIKPESKDDIMNFFKRHGKGASVFDDGQSLPPQTTYLPQTPYIELHPTRVTIHQTASLPIETDERKRLIGALITIRNHCLNCDGDHEKCMLRAKNDTSVVCPFENFGYPKDWLINLTEEDDLLEIK